MGFICIILIFMIIGGIRGYYEECTWKAIFPWGFVGGLFGLLVGFVVTLIASTIPGPVYVDKTETQNLYALEDNIISEGRFFLGSGVMDGESKYYYLYETRDGGYRMSEADAEDTTLYYISENEVPHIEMDTRYFLNPVHRFFGISPDILSCEYRIYIPQGTIMNNYRVDLQ